MLPAFVPFVLSLVSGFIAGDFSTAPRVAATCAPIAGKGRIRCAVEVESATEIRWAEFIVREAPRFADPLRGRMGPLEAVSRSNFHWKWEFGFAGQVKGEGSALIEVRAVLCTGEARDELCRPSTVSLRVPLRVD